jgi:polar amino acid transport system substrate-binding protein
MSYAAIAALAPHGILRAGINLSNGLLVTGRAEDGNPIGVAPDMARAIAGKLQVPIQYVTFPSPGAVADAANKDIWDIGLIGNEPARAEMIDFTNAYVEIEATYLVPAGSVLQTIGEVDQKGIRIAVESRSAFELWLTRNIQYADLMRSTGFDATYKNFVESKLEAWADLRPRLALTVKKLPGARILEGKFTAVQQAIGTTKGNAEGIQFLREFVEASKASGFVNELIERHSVHGLTVAPPDDI